MYEALTIFFGAGSDINRDTVGRDDDRYSIMIDRWLSLIISRHKARRALRQTSSIQFNFNSIQFIYFHFIFKKYSQSPPKIGKANRGGRSNTQSVVKTHSLWLKSDWC